MKKQRRQRSSLVTGSMIVLLLAAWLALAPPQLGGSTHLIIINGNSMEPGLHRGDLVFVRAASSYAIGQIVTYQHPQIGPVIHRIIGRNGRHYVFKGDHNEWIDSYHPAESELLGAYWFYIPKAGKAIEWLRAPAHMALLVFLIGGTSMLTTAQEHERRRQRLQRYAEELRASTPSPVARQSRRPALDRATSSQQPAPNAIQRGSLETAQVAIFALLGGALLLAGLAFTRPTERSADSPLLYTQKGTFSYSASAPGSVYDTGTAQSGEPIFRALVREVPFEFNYSASTELSHQWGGSYRLLAELGANDGWKRTLELQPRTNFSGDQFAARGTLDLAGIKTLTDQIEEQTGIKHEYYTVAIVPQIELAGTLAGQPLRDTSFAPRLRFRLNDLEMQIQSDTSSDTNPFTPSQEGMLAHSTIVPNTIALLGMQLGVLPARWIALAVAALALIAGVWLARKHALAGLVDEPTRIQFEYGPRLIAVQDSDMLIAEDTVEVANFSDLARLAEREERMILYERCGPIHHYVVQIAGTRYHYRVVEASMAAREVRP